MKRQGVWEDSRMSSTMYIGELRIVVTRHLDGAPGEYYGAVYGGWLSHSASDSMISLGSDREEAKVRWIKRVRARLERSLKSLSELS